MFARQGTAQIDGQFEYIRVGGFLTFYLIGVISIKHKLGVKISVSGMAI